MKKESLKALEDSIKHWDMICYGLDISKGSKNCPLCDMFSDNECVGCPVNQAEENRIGCENTPYDEYHRHQLAFERWRSNIAKSAYEKKLESAYRLIDQNGDCSGVLCNDCMCATVELCDSSNGIEKEAAMREAIKFIKEHEESAKPKPRTKERDYTGCDPEIARYLKKGLFPECEVWDDEECRVEYVTNYNAEREYRYETIGDVCKNAKLHIREQKVKKASKIVKWLEDNGYTTNENGDWVPGTGISFIREMFYYCGKEKPNKWEWLPEWLEG